VAGGVDVALGGGVGPGPEWEAIGRTWRTPGTRYTPSLASLHSIHTAQYVTIYTPTHMYKSDSFSTKTSYNKF